MIQCSHGRFGDIVGGEMLEVSHQTSSKQMLTCLCILSIPKDGNSGAVHCIIMHGHGKDVHASDAGNLPR